MRALVLFVVIGSVLGFEDVTIIQYLQDHGYNNLTTAIDRVGLTYQLNTTGPYTVFAPTDEAFMRAGVVSLDIFTSVQLTAIVQYAIVPEFVLIPNILTLEVKETLLGQNLTVEPDPPTLLVNNVSYVDSINNDIIVNNGVIQPVETLMSPPVWPTQPAYNIYQLILLNDDLYTDLALVVVLAEMEHVLQSGEYTLFAPTNAAFAKHGHHLPNPSDPNAKTIHQEVLKNHLVPGARTSDQLYNGQTLYTLHNTPLYVYIGFGVQVAGGNGTANVIDTDIMAVNGVIHAVDDLLIPTDL